MLILESINTSTDWDLMHIYTKSVDQQSVQVDEIHAQERHIPILQIRIFCFYVVHVRLTSRLGRL